MKNSVLKLLILIIICAGLAFTSAAQAAKNYAAERFDVVIDVQPGGELLVTETIVFRFEGGPFTFVFREINAVETDGISGLQASMDGQPMPEGDAAGQAQIHPGDPVRVTWHFNPASDSVHTFDLSYRVHGAIRKQSSDTLIWRAIPEDHEYPIESTTITLRYPAGVSLTGAPTLNRQATNTESSANQVVLSARDIPGDNPVILAAQFEPDSLITTPPGWQVQDVRTQNLISRAWPIGLGSAFGVLFLAVTWLSAALRRARREDFIAPDASQRLSLPPSNLPPAAGVKLGAGSMPALATLFDLASRGFIRIEEQKSRWGKSFRIYRQQQDKPLHLHEQALLEALFITNKGERDSLPMAEAGQKIANNRFFTSTLEDEMLAAGWLDPQRMSLRHRLSMIGLGLLLAGMVTAIAMFVIAAIAARNGAENSLLLAAGSTGAGAALFLAGLIIMIAGSALSPLSNQGEHEAARWKGFLAYLRDVSRGREPAMRPDLFELYLPFAAGAGFAEGWAKFFQKQGGAPMPVWFRTLSGSMDGSEFAMIVALMASSDSSTSAASSGGAGASGGGASGAG